MYRASSSSIIYRTRYSPPSPFNFALESQKSIMIGSASASLYSPFGRLYVNRGLAGSTSPALLEATSLPSRGAAGVALVFAFALGLDFEVTGGVAEGVG